MQTQPPPQYGQPPPGQYGQPPPGQYGQPPPGQYGQPQPQFASQSTNNTTVVMAGGGGPSAVVVNHKERCADKTCLNICLTLIFPPWLIIWICLCICEK